MPYYKSPTGEVQLIENPDLNPSLIAGKTQTDYQGNAITSADLQPTTPIGYSSESTTSPPPIPPTPTVDESLGQTETAADTLIKQIMSGNTALEGKSAYQTEQEATVGIPGLQKTQRDLVTQLTQLANEQLGLQNDYNFTIPNQMQLQAEGRGVTAAGLQPLTASELRKNQIQQGVVVSRALGLNSLFASSQGALASAQDFADRAVAAKFGPLEEANNTRIANLELLLKSPSLTLEQEKRANAQKRKEEAEKAKIEKAKTDATTAQGLANTVIKYNSDKPEALKAAQDILALDSSSPTYLLDAYKLASGYLTDPKAKYELESAKLDNDLKTEQIKTSKAQRAKIEKETGEIGQPTAAEKKAAEAEKKAAEGVVSAASEQIKQINKLLAHSSLEAAVGPSLLKPFARAGFQGGGKGDFIASVKLLTSGGTLKTLLDLKQAGGTLGALSEGERQMLESAFSKISTWEVKDDDTVVGYNTTETNFKRELNRIKTLAEKAITRAGENLITPDEDNALDTYLSTSILNQPSFTNPVDYFTNPL